jgi:hypothetical protein
LRDKAADLEEAHMKHFRALLVVALAIGLATPATAATTIPPSLDARAAQLRQKASAPILAWVHDQGVTLAKAHGAIDLGGTERAIQSQFGMTQNPGATNYANLGNLGDADIMALCFIVMMEAAKSAEDDLKAIMEGVKSINEQKAEQRAAAEKLKTRIPTPTPAPDRVAQLVAKAQSIVGKTQGANLSRVARR